MAGELRCKAIRYKTALPLIQGGSATAGPMCAERCPRDYVCEPAVPNFKAHPVVGHKENGESIFRYIYTDIQKELTVKLRQSIEVYQSVELTEESRMALGQRLGLRNGHQDPADNFVLCIQRYYPEHIFPHNRRDAAIGGGKD